VTSLLLDTTLLVDVERGDAAVEHVIADDDDVAVAAISIAELMVGVATSTSRLRRRRQSFLDGIVESIPILSYDRAVAVAHANLLVAVRRAGRPRGAHDLIIAATGVASGRTVVSADRRAFEGLPGVAAIDHRTA
jgi:tRNA(fMet)-specific endonuclease VapC